MAWGKIITKKFGIDKTGLLNKSAGLSKYNSMNLCPLNAQCYAPLLTTLLSEIINISGYQQVVHKCNDLSKPINCKIKSVNNLFLEPHNCGCQANHQNVLNAINRLITNSKNFKIKYLLLVQCLKLNVQCFQKNVGIFESEKKYARCIFV